MVKDATLGGRGNWSSAAIGSAVQTSGCDATSAVMCATVWNALLFVRGEDGRLHLRTHFAENMSL
jgi:hypothetical protein